ncbi:MAG: ATP-binding cassette domain-containing protein [Phycisphaerales bacterium]|nr:ATP-binding cassette domain-containing protein [Phycisphaerales bacterium]
MSSGVNTARIPDRPAPPAASPIIRLEALEKRFGSQVVLDGVSLSFDEAKTTVIMGPSGCGKSVMLKHIVGLLRPDAGAVYYGGLRVDRLSERRWGPIRQDIGLLFQMSALFDSMTVAENIEFPLREHTSLSSAQRERRIAEALEVVDMLGFEQRLPAQLSGGQRKRVALARAIVLRPRVVLYDEPTTGLDPIRAAGIDGLILKLRRTMGVTNIVVTHDLTSAERIADTAVMLLQGRVAAQGPFASLRTCPDPRVQHFLKGVYDRAEDRATDQSPPDPDSPDRP